MKTLLLVLALLVIGYSSLLAQRVCETPEYHHSILTANPEMAAKQQSIEHFLHSKLNAEEVMATLSGNDAAPKIYRIPVVVHILYKDDKQNISEAQIKSQIDALNRDFRMAGQELASIIPAFRDRAGDAYIEFALATRDPQGRASNGIVRKKTSIQFFGLDNRIKQTSIGGSDPWDATQYLNIWVGSLAGGLIGYSSEPGSPVAFDGVVIKYSAFGQVGTLSGTFNKGRTATHEIGHWLGLKHIWGDTHCGDDGIADTPPQRGASSGCPKGIVSTCNNGPLGDMYMNFMDLTNDGCMALFTQGQVNRMRAHFAEGGPRNSLLSSKGLEAPLLPELLPLPEETTAIEIDVFPNPAPRYLQVRLNEQNNLIGKELQVFNQQGREVYRTRITRNDFQIELQGWQTGMYAIRIAGTAKTVKFIKAG